ncbi:MAG: cob(I)yrinic acid a,c-diamide adenosyltransferase [Myxococcales bacterium]|nr:cob(I)yrinic acid a,c-diamide adenosyltransferase [Myxococcales bacterium]MCB9544987.1 cob(I)yrinic acid a,c-diamide adenosyltransferase [Myxococcales bacterium]
MPTDPPAEGRFADPELVINRVYTRTGDRGQTRLVGGQKISKHALRIECYGTVDELNAAVGLARLECLELKLDGLAAWLRRVQHALFNLGSLLATLPEDVHPRQPRVQQADVDALEAAMDAANADLPVLRSFVLPGGNRANVALHQARTVCRRAERLCVRLAEEEAVDPVAVPYLNRLSDALFVWSRAAAVQAGHEEVLWAPNEG